MLREVRVIGGTLELEKTVRNRWTCFGVRVSRTLEYPTVNLNPR